MRTFPLILCALISFALSACFRYPTPYRAENGKIAYATQVMGKIVHTINADGSEAITSDMEVSGQHVTQMLTAVGLGYIDMLKTEILEITKQLSNKNLTAVQLSKLKTDLAFKTAELQAAERLKSQGIGAGAPLGQVNF
jgi:hypothetical protein